MPDLVSYEFAQAVLSERLRIVSQLQKQQRSTPNDLSLAHDLGVLCFWSARHLGDSEESGKYWHQVVANWAMVLENDDYWQTWIAERSRVYGETLSEEVRRTARHNITERLLQALGEHDRRQPVISRTFPLEMAYHLEARTISLLKRTKGLPRGDNLHTRLFCGPLMIQHLALGDQVSQLIRDLPEPGDELSSFLTILRRLVSEESGSSLDLFDTQSRRRLMHCFSELGPAFIYVDRGEPQKALELLAAVRCPECGSRPQSRSFQENGCVTLPRVCAGDCAQFAERNPAYALLPNRGDMLFRHAVELTAEAHMALAEQRVRAEPPDAAAAVQHWQDALEVAAAIGAREQFQDALVDMTVGRALALERKHRLDDAIALLEAAQQLGQQDRLTGKLAELLTDRGVQAGNERRWNDAVAHLRRALTINPHVTRTRNNLVTALRGAAASHFQTGEREKARPFLEEAIQVLETGLKQDAANEDWQRKLIETQMELAAVGGQAAEGALGNVLGLLESLLEGAGLGDEETVPAKAEAMRLMAQAGEEAARENYKAALEITERALQLDPDSPLLLRGLSSMINNYGVQLAKADKFDEAVAVLERGVKQFPDDEALQRNLRNVRQAQEFHRLATTGSPLERLGALLSMLMDQAEEETDTKSPAALVTTGPGPRRANELAERGRDKARRQEYPAAIADLEEALRLAPEEASIRRSLADVMEKHADALIAQGKREEGLAVARRGLVYVPDHTGLRATVSIAQAMDRAGGASPAAKLLGLLSSLAEATGATSGWQATPLKSSPAEPAAAAAIRAHLDQTDLKYQQLGDNRYILPFRTDRRGRVMVQLQTVADMAVVSAPIFPGPLGETDLLYNWLRATHTADIYKLCRSGNGDLLLVAEAPATVLTPASLEGLIRGAVHIIDVPDEEMASVDKLLVHIRAVQIAQASQDQDGTGEKRGLLGLFRRRGDGENAAQQVPTFCWGMRIPCKQLKSNRFHLTVGPMSLDIVAVCKGKAVSFIGFMGGMRPARGHTRFYQRLAEINAQMDVCKLALDSDDDPAFMYELPALDQAAFRQMRERMETYIMRYGMELMQLA